MDLRINEDKTKYMISLKRKASHHQFGQNATIGNNNLEVVKEFIYLGGWGRIRPLEVKCRTRIIIVLYNLQDPHSSYPDVRLWVVNHGYHWGDNFQSGLPRWGIEEDTQQPRTVPAVRRNWISWTKKQCAEFALVRSFWAYGRERTTKTYRFRSTFDGGNIVLKVSRIYKNTLFF